MAWLTHSGSCKLSGKMLIFHLIFLLPNYSHLFDPEATDHRCKNFLPFLPFSPIAAAPTEVLKLLVVLASFHLQVELVLVRAEMEEILTGLAAVSLEQVFNLI